MQNLIRSMEANLRNLSENSYPGRGIILGKSAEGKLLQFYWIMGRSDNSRNRIFTAEKGVLKTEPFNPAKVEDPSLVIYKAMGEVSGHYLVSNGDHTETLIKEIKKGGTYRDALNKRIHEPDEPNWTPRIAGGTILDNGKGSAWLGILRSDPFNTSNSHRFYFEYPELHPGLGWCITTYKGDGTPLPSYQGEPIPLPLSGERDALIAWIWPRLNEQNRISLALKIIDPVTGESEILIENKYKK